MFVPFCSVSTGNPRPSGNPPSLQSFKKSASRGMDRAGGGVVIPCKYILNVKRGEIDDVMHFCKSFFGQYEGEEKLVIVDEANSCCV